MSDMKTHLVIGSLAGGLAYIGYKIYKKEEIALDGILKSIIVGGIFSLAPDFLEPATNPNHRAFLHSIIALLSGGYVGYKELKSDSADDTTKELLIAAFAGYGSHLLADGMTPKSIPVLQ